MTMRRTTGALLALAAAAMLTAAGLAGCGGTGPGSASGSAANPTGPGDAGYPVTITDKYGTTTIPARPTRIVALSYEEDDLALVGVNVVGHADNVFAPGRLYPWQEGKVDLSGSQPVLTGSNTLNLEKIVALRPDLILATMYYDLDSSHDELSQIAPVIGYRTTSKEASWEETAEVIGRAVGREGQMREATDRVRTYLDGLGAQLPGLRGKTYIGAYHYATGQFVVNANRRSPRAQLLTRLGMVPSPTVPDAAANTPVSAERLDLLNADLLTVGTANGDLRTGLGSDPLFTRLPVVRDGRSVVVDQFAATASNNPTLLNIPWSLDRQRDVLAKVAAKSQ